MRYAVPFAVYYGTIRIVLRATVTVTVTVTVTGTVAVTDARLHFHCSGTLGQ